MHGFLGFRRYRRGRLGELGAALGEILRHYECHTPGRYVEAIEGEKGMK